MLIVTLFAVSLLVPVAADPGTAWPPVSDRAGAGLPHMSLQQKRAAIRPLETSANACIAIQVSANPRLKAKASAVAVNELIVESVPTCIDAVRAMMDAHDRMFGDGAGESYFTGPYLDALPAAVRALMDGGPR